MPFTWNDHFIPLGKGHPVWTDPFVGGLPSGVTWHWTGGVALERARNQLTGGRGPFVSAHYCVGRSFGEGVDRYVSLEHRSGHCGKGQSVRWDGNLVANERDKASRTTIGIETVNRGHARAGVSAESDWLDALIDNHSRRQVQPWTEEQMVMMIEVGKEIQLKYPHLTERNHHGHMDLAPGRKVDPAGLDYARILSAIYNKPVPDIWKAFNSVRARQFALFKMSLLPESEVTGIHTRKLETALMAYQTSKGFAANGRWNTMTAWKMLDDLAALGVTLEGEEFRALAADPTTRRSPRSGRANH